ncbi:hypothetical protein S245_058377, partial [Arachis hypogaea]
QKPCDPPLPECDKDEEPSLPEGGKDENPPLPEGGNDEKKERNMFVKGAKRGTEPVEEWISQANEQVLYGDYVSVSISCNETLQLWIKRLKEEEQYEVIDYRDKLCRYFGKLGYIRLMHFIAEPKYTKNMPNASEDTAKHFYARMHQMPNRETHVDYCKLYEGPPQPGLHFSQEVIPLCCETCGLKDLKALDSKSMELSAEGEGRKEEYWNGYHTSTPPKIMVARRRNPEVLAEQVARRKRKQPVEEVKFNSSMKEAAAIPYNLRCNGRVVGERYLRPRQVQLDHSSNKPLSVNHSSKKRRPRRRQKPCDPPLPECDKDEEPSLPEAGKDENAPLLEGGKDEKKERNMFVKGAKRGTEPVEEYLRQMRRYFIETMFPYPLAAMKHYNYGLKEEEQYKVTDTRDDLCRLFKKLGCIRLLHFIAEPKYPKNTPNTSEDTTKHFYARMHQMPNRETHVDYCKLYEEPPEGTFITQVIPLCCETCGLKDLKALESKSMELRFILSFILELKCRRWRRKGGVLGWLLHLNSSKSYGGTQKKPRGLSRTSRQEKEKALNGS